MDRYLGTEVFNRAEVEEAAALAAAEHHQLLLEQRAWEQDRAAVAEYESWYLQKTILEADAENIGAR